jgi:hypothetical protein
MNPSAQTEYDARLDTWRKLINAGGPIGVSPQLLRDLGIYGGAQGIWVDKTRTHLLSNDGEGVTVGVLHTGSSYPDDLGEDNVIYHYPKTNRPLGRDLSEVKATKTAKDLNLPIFVITYPTPHSTKRDVHLGWIRDWDDESRQFLIGFGETAPKPVPPPTDEDEAAFVPLDEKQRQKTMVTARPVQAEFKFKVFKRYGPRCGVCGVDVPELLDAAHLTPKSENGSDDPRNGLVLCATHHRAFDALLFALEPQTLTIHVKDNGPNLEQLRITHPSLQHLRLKPHPHALKWHWDKWLRVRGKCLVD